MLRHVAQFYLLLKAQGMLVKDHPVIAKLAEARIFMEKLRPLDAKLKYQMDKLLKTANGGADSASTGGPLPGSAPGRPSLTTSAPDCCAACSLAGDALKFKPNPNALLLPEFGGAVDDEGEKRSAQKLAAEDGGDGEREEGDKSGLYRPPKITAMHFEDKAEAKKRREREKASRRASKSEIVMALREEYDDAPMEESHHVVSPAPYTLHSTPYALCTYPRPETEGCTMCPPNTHAHAHMHTRAHTQSCTKQASPSTHPLPPPLFLVLPPLEYLKSSPFKYTF